MIRGLYMCLSCNLITDINMLDTQLKYLGSNKNKTKMYSKNLKLRPCNSEIGYIYNIFLWMEIFFICYIQT